MARVSVLRHSRESGNPVISRLAKPVNLRRGADSRALLQECRQTHRFASACLAAQRFTSPTRKYGFAFSSASMMNSWPVLAGS